MRKVLVFSVFLLVGLIGSQWLPGVLGAAYAGFGDVVRFLTMVGLSFIMIRVGYEFDIDKSNLKQYGWDYVVAFTAASFPWLFVTFYFIFVLFPSEYWGMADAWKETLLAGRFAAPTSAGVLFSMLAAAGLGATWLYRKARVLAIFDDLDTVLLMLPLKMLMIGLAWQLGIVVVAMVTLVALAYVFLHKIRLPMSWYWIIIYSVIIAAFSELAYRGSKLIAESVPIHIEVLLPAFTLGCVAAYPKHDGADSTAGTSEFHPLETAMDKKVTTLVTLIFMLLVGLSMPAIFTDEASPDAAEANHIDSTLRPAASPTSEARATEMGEVAQTGRITASLPPMPFSMMILHVIIVTLISNLGKMFPALCYRKEAHWRERMAVAIGMWPRGEVGAGVLVISLSYGIGGPIVTIAMMSLALNLLLTGVFIYFVKRLTGHLPAYEV